MKLILSDGIRLDGDLYRPVPNDLVIEGINQYTWSNALEIGFHDVKAAQAAAAVTGWKAPAAHTLRVPLKASDNSSIDDEADFDHSPSVTTRFAVYRRFDIVFDDGPRPAPFVEPGLELERLALDVVNRWERNLALPVRALDEHLRRLADDRQSHAGYIERARSIAARMDFEVDDAPLVSVVPGKGVHVGVWLWIPDLF